MISGGVYTKPTTSNTHILNEIDRINVLYLSKRKLNALPPTKCAKMTDEHGMLRNGSIDSVGIAGRELNVDSTIPSATTITSTTTTTTTTATANATSAPSATTATTAATTTTTTTANTITTNSVNTNLPNNDGNNNENATTQNDINNSQNDRQSNSPIDNENGNNHFVSGGGVNSGGGGGSGVNCTSNGNYNTTTGNGSNANSKQPNHSTNYSNSNNGSPLHNPCGGRLQFFKDGKFILELARSKEGDRGWISVPRKTYWPPAALSQNNLNNHKNESSTSLSFSDDNSSIQSSPWQRDHSWKQPSPRKNISKDLCMYYYRPVPIILNGTSKIESKRLRRQPSKRMHTNTVQYAKRTVQNVNLLKIKDENLQLNNDKNKLAEINEHIEKHNKDNDGDDIVDSPSVKVENQTTTNDDVEKMDYNIDDESDLKSNDTTIITDNNEIANCMRVKRKLLQTTKISNVIEKLIARVCEKPMNVTSSQTGLGIQQFSATSRPNDLFYPHQHVSPRKRILREFEKVSLEDRNSNTQKRSRSKSNASNDYTNVSNSKASSGYSIVVAQQTANIACNNKDEPNRITNGSPPRPIIPMDITEKSFKHSKSITTPTTMTTANFTKISHTQATNELNPSTQPISKPISNYSIISLLGHNNSNSNNDNKMETNTMDDRMHSESRRSPRSPISYNHQMLTNNRSAYVSKKKSPTNTANVLVNSPTNYRNARSPDINSPSPGLQSNSHHNRYHPATLSSPSSSFHPYLSSSRASPLSSGTLSPTDLYRHRSYRTAGSPSTMSNSSLSGLTHQYPSLNGSPTTFAASSRYSPSTYSSSTKTSPGSDRQTSSQSHSMSTAYNMSNLLPSSTYDSGNLTTNTGDTHRYSPSHLKQHTSDWSPARTTVSSGRGSPTNYTNSSNNSLSTTTIPKKTASIRQKYGSLSPNGFACGNSNEHIITTPTSTSSSASASTKFDSNSNKKYPNDPIAESKYLTKRPKTPEIQHKKATQAQELYDKDLQARYNAEVTAMHHQSLIASALQQQAANPFYHMYGGGNVHGANLPQSMTAAAAAAYMNPLYYHHSASELFRKSHPTAAMDLLHKNLVPSWIDPYSAAMMPYPPISAAAAAAAAASLSDKVTLTAAKSQNDAHSMLMSPYSIGRSISDRRNQTTNADIDMWNVNDTKKSPITSTSSSSSAPPSAFRRQPQQLSDCEPIYLIKDEPSSDVPLNLSKH